MAWPLRVGLFAFGLFLMLTAKTELDAGHWVFLHATYRQTTFAAGAYGVGAVFCMLAFLPPDNWMYRHNNAIAETQASAVASASEAPRLARRLR
jgi:hypothetical protein